MILFGELEKAVITSSTLLKMMQCEKIEKKKSNLRQLKDFAISWTSRNYL